MNVQSGEEFGVEVLVRKRDASAVTEPAGIQGDCRRYPFTDLWRSIVFLVPARSTEPLYHRADLVREGVVDGSMPRLLCRVQNH